MPPLTFLVLAAAIAALALIPTRRLFTAGWTSGPLAAYFLILVGLGLLVAELRGPARYLIPIFILAYIAPFVTARDGVSRIRGRFGGSAGPTRPTGGATRPEPPRPPPRNVTPSDD
jgi:hypothetical protein